MSQPTSFDPDLAASLHNKIISHVYGDGPLSRYAIRPFFSVFEDEPMVPLIRENIPADHPLIQFLKQINIAVDPNGTCYSGNESAHGFTPELMQPNPGIFSLLESEEWWDEGLSDEESDTEDQPAAGADESGEAGSSDVLRGGHFPNSVLLYAGHQCTDLQYPRGVWFDVYTHLATIRPRVDLQTHVRPEDWVPLQVHLQRYLDFYLCGKFQINPVNASEGDEGLVWRLYCEHDLSTSISAYNELLCEIESRRPGGNSNWDPEAAQGNVLVDEETLDRHSIGGFAKKFLSTAQRPPFTYLAPGLRYLTPEILDSDTIDTEKSIAERARLRRIQETERYEGHDMYMLTHVLFPSDVDVLVSSLAGKRAGLYSQPGDDRFCDGVRMVARVGVEIGNRSSGDQGAEVRTIEKESEFRQDALMQHGGLCPFFDGHSVRLPTVLKLWTKLVREGEFVVGEDGVKGDIQWWEKRENILRTITPQCWLSE